ncbi:rhodanese-like domain-containing protein [Thioclava litoralis]|uniref:Rhodanese-like domain-containing protein n=1 Tax=Thioclava litoralis TaxID=3076557 RepID=A0ABZ1DYF3_9RHOB|nr:rhodanese-like domain-containing protein [Thioclava sp. FTW29]
MFGFLRRRGSAIPKIEARDARERVRAGTLVLIDVREDGEVRQTGRAKGALHIPVGSLLKKAHPDSAECLPQLATCPPVALYCVSGSRSENAAKMLQQMGYQEVFNMVSLRYWQAAGGEIEV